MAKTERLIFIEDGYDEVVGAKTLTPEEAFEAGVLWAAKQFQDKFDMYYRKDEWGERDYVDVKSVFPDEVRSKL